MITPKIGNAMTAAVDRHNYSREEKLTILEKAIETARTSTKWASGQSRTVLKGTLRGKKAEIYLYCDQGGINLLVFIDAKTLRSRFISKPFRIGYFNPETGLEVSRMATENNYLQWNKETIRAIS